MNIPIWALATIAYIVGILLVIFVGKKPAGYMDLFAPFVNLLIIFALTIGYLIFWIIYLALK